MDLLAKELVDLKCDVLIGFTAPPALALQRATSTIPIVFTFNTNPVASGLVESLNHPGGNVTGATQMTADLAAKRVDVLRDAIPGLSSMALVYDPDLQSNTSTVQNWTTPAQRRAGLACHLKNSNAAVHSFLKKQFRRPAALAQRYLATALGTPSR